MRPSIAALLLAGCCLLAGCTGALTGTGTTTDPATDGPTADGPTTDRPAPGDVPGVAEGRLANASALVAAHEAAVEDRSMTVAFRHEVRLPNGTVDTSRASVTRYGPDHVRRNGTLTAYERGDRNARVNVGTWSNATVGFTRHESGYGEIRHLVYRPTTATPLANASLLTGEARPTLEGRPVTVEALADGGYRLAVSNLTTDAWSNVTVEATVTERGVLSEYRFAGEETVRGTTYRVVRTIRFSAVGATTLERPDWLPTAIDESGWPGPSAGNTTG